MRTFQQQQQYEPFEQRSLQVRELVSWELQRLWQVASAFWQLSKEPQVRQKTDHDSNVYWQVYDPLQDCILRFDDEQNVMIWLEAQHYRQSRELWNLG